ncbi:hypothetical protein SELMODRAFT_404915 [Selaginella moellendorffii]|uniref:Uncharacterized protein n=1 Tax=Selaginella moellendorffii TaxID=88036 RepID=D8QXS7_SELML|nr:hypothetical protein SELMODRAFT_404915 [Selaginella moellendorffii]
MPLMVLYPGNQSIPMHVTWCCFKAVLLSRFFILDKLKEVAQEGRKHNSVRSGRGKRVGFHFLAELSELLYPRADRVGRDGVLNVKLLELISSDCGIEEEACQEGLIQYGLARLHAYGTLEVQDLDSLTEGSWRTIRTAYGYNAQSRSSGIGDGYEMIAVEMIAKAMDGMQPANLISRFLQDDVYTVTSHELEIPAKIVKPRIHSEQMAQMRHKARMCMLSTPDLETDTASQQQHPMTLIPVLVQVKTSKTLYQGSAFYLDLNKFSQHKSTFK